MANKKRPYKHLLKNLFHEQATEIIPLLWPDYQVEKVLDVEIPELKSTPIEGPPGALETGLVEFVLPGATVVGSYKTELIEHSGNFERAYRVVSINSKTKKRTYLVIEFQCEPEDEELPRRFLCNFVQVNLYADEEGEQNLTVFKTGQRGRVMVRRKLPVKEPHPQTSTSGCPAQTQQPRFFLHSYVQHTPAPA